MVLSRVVSFLVTRLLSFLFVDSEDHRTSLSLQTLTLHDLRLDPAKIRRVLGPKHRIRVISGQVRTLRVDLSGTVHVVGVEIVLGAAATTDPYDDQGADPSTSAQQREEGWGEWLLGPMRRAAERALDNLVVKVERAHVVVEDGEGGSFHFRAAEMLSSAKDDHQPHLAYARSFSLSGFSLKHRDSASRWSFVTERRIDCRVDAGATADAQSLFVDLVFTSESLALCASEQAIAALRSLLARAGSDPPDQQQPPREPAAPATSHLADSVSGLWTKASEGVASLFSPWMKRHDLDDEPPPSSDTSTTSLSLPASEDSQQHDSSQASLSMLLSSFDLAHSALTISVTAPLFSVAFEAVATLRAADHVSGLLFECPRRMVGAEVAGLALTAAWRGAGCPPAVRATLTRLTALAYCGPQGSPPEPVGDILAGPSEESASSVNDEWVELGRPAAVVTVSPERALTARLGSVAARLTPRGLGVLQLALEAATRLLAQSPRASSQPPLISARLDVEELRVEVSSPAVPQSVLGLVSQGVTAVFTTTPRSVALSGEAVQLFFSELVLVRPVGISVSLLAINDAEEGGVACEVMGVLEAVLDGPALYDVGRLCYIFAGELEEVGCVAAWAADPVPVRLFHEAAAAERPRPARPAPPAPPAPVSLRLVCPALRVRAGGIVLTGERISLYATADKLSFRLEGGAEFAMAEEASTGKVLLRLSSTTATTTTTPTAGSAPAEASSTFFDRSSDSPRLLKAMTTGASIYDLSMPGSHDTPSLLLSPGPIPVWAVYSVQRKTEHAVPKVGLAARVSGLHVDLDAPGPWASLVQALSFGNPALPRKSEQLLEQLKGPELRLLHLTLRLVARERARRNAELARGPGVTVIRSSTPLGRLGALHRPLPWCRVTMAEVEGFYMGLLSTVSVSLAEVTMSHGPLDVSLPRALVQSESEEGFEHGRLSVSITAPKVLLMPELATARDVRARVKSTLTRGAAEAEHQTHGLSIASLVARIPEEDHLEVLRCHLFGSQPPAVPNQSKGGWGGFWRLRVDRAEVQAGAWAATVTGADAEILGEVLTFAVGDFSSPGLAAARSIQGRWERASGTAVLTAADPYVRVRDRGSLRSQEITARVSLTPTLSATFHCPATCVITIIPTQTPTHSPSISAPAVFAPISFSFELPDVALTILGHAEARFSLSIAGTASPDGTMTCLATSASLAAQATNRSWRLSIPDPHRVRVVKSVDAFTWLTVTAEASEVAVDLLLDLDLVAANRAADAPSFSLLSFARFDLSVRSLSVGPARVDHFSLRTNPRLSGAVDATLSSLTASVAFGPFSVSAASVGVEVESLGPGATVLLRADEASARGPEGAAVAVRGVTGSASQHAGLSIAWDRVRASTALGSLVTASGQAHATLHPLSVLLVLRDPCEIVQSGSGSTSSDPPSFPSSISVPPVVVPGLGAVPFEVRALGAIAVEAPLYSLELEPGAGASLDASGLSVRAPGVKVATEAGDLGVRGLELCVHSGIVTCTVGALDGAFSGVTLSAPEGATVALQGGPRWALEVTVARAEVTAPQRAISIDTVAPPSALRISNRSSRAVMVRCDRDPGIIEVPAGEDVLLPTGTRSVAVQVHAGSWTASTPLSLSTRRWVFLDSATSVELAFSRCGLDISAVVDHERTVWRGSSVEPGHFAVNSHPLTDLSLPLTARPWGITSAGGDQIVQCRCLVCDLDGPALDELHECRDGRVYSLRARHPDLILEVDPAPGPATTTTTTTTTFSLQVDHLAVHALDCYTVHVEGVGLQASAVPWHTRADVSLSASASKIKARSASSPNLAALVPSLGSDMSILLECAGVASVKGRSLLLPEVAVTIPGTTTTDLSLQDIVDALRLQPPPTTSTATPAPIQVARWRLCNSPEVIMSWDATKGQDQAHLLPASLQVLASLPDLKGALLRPKDGLTTSNIASFLTALSMIGSPQSLFRTLKSWLN
jgi:hypothetical protein